MPYDPFGRVRLLQERRQYSSSKAKIKSRFKKEGPKAAASAGLGGLAGYGVVKKLQSLGHVARGKKLARSGAIVGGVVGLAALSKFRKKRKPSSADKFMNDYYSNINNEGDWIDGTKIDRKFRKKYKIG